jgi:quinol monooxygenase YgiN
VTDRYPAKVKCAAIEGQRLCTGQRRIEPAVLTRYAVALTDNSSHIRILEVYADAAAYKSHLETPHFKKYKALTRNMVQFLKLIETDPVVLGTKCK